MNPVFFIMISKLSSNSIIWGIDSILVCFFLINTLVDGSILPFHISPRTKDKWNFFHRTSILMLFLATRTLFVVWNVQLFLKMCLMVNFSTVVVCIDIGILITFINIWSASSVIYSNDTWLLVRWMSYLDSGVSMLHGSSQSCVLGHTYTWYICLDYFSWCCYCFLRCIFTHAN